MLRMLTDCERCRARLGHDGEAWICSYECTYCPACAGELPTCPNCGGELVRRPRRTTGVLEISGRLPARIARRVLTLIGR